MTVREKESHAVLIKFDQARGRKLRSLSEKTGVSRPRLLELLFDRYADEIELRVGGKVISATPTSEAEAVTA